MTPAPSTSFLNPRIAAPFLLVALIWGSTWWVITGQIDGVPASWAVVWRFVIAAPAMALMALATGSSLKIGAKGQGLAILVGLTQFCGNYNFVYEAERHLTSGIVAVMLSLLGVLTGVWADKFDHASAVTNFVIQPLTLLSGTFYAIDKVNPTMAMISHANPFFYIIDGFRSGFIGTADGLLVQGAVVLALVNVTLWAVCYRVIRSGWRLKA